MQVVVYAKAVKDKDLPYVEDLFSELSKRGIYTFVYQALLIDLKGRIQLPGEVGVIQDHRDFLLRKFDYVITLGGDGTILDAVTVVRESKVPIIGINLGRLGFLASIEKRMIGEALDLISRGMYQIQERVMLYLESNIPVFGETRFALNDFTILKRDTSSMITIHTYINGAYLSTYWADGIIVATPTGSTGYSLSCGGPIVFPNSGNFVITPVAPHNLNVRPLVISDNSVVSFEVEGRTDNFLCTLDSRFETITSEHQLAIRKCDFAMRLVQLPERSFLRTIREKLVWGQDTRND